VSEQKVPAVPVWYKNTYFWIAALLVILGVIGLAVGDNAIRDPGQKVEHGLCWLYFVAAVVMLVGGLVSHRQTVQQYQEETGSKA
jgi:hypothetical protein